MVEIGTFFAKLLSIFTVPWFWPLLISITTLAKEELLFTINWLKLPEVVVLVDSNTSWGLVELDALPKKIILKEDGPVKDLEGTSEDKLFIV